MLTLLPKWKLYRALKKGIVYIALFLIRIKHDIFLPFCCKIIDLNQPGFVKKVFP